jgi:DTW domain-containing protein YfiP
MQPNRSEHRCPRCAIRKALCFCEFIPHIDLQTRLVIVMHTSEQALTTNTGRLAATALANSKIRIRGRKNEPMSATGLVQHGRHALLLYPSPHAVELDDDSVSQFTGPVTLIVPDGSWAQTRRIVRREAALACIPHVKLPNGQPSEYHLRLQPADGRLCTLEAIARTIGITAFDPRWASGIIIYRAEQYTKIPDFWAIKVPLHELAHAHHLEQWADDQEDILNAWKNAVKQGLYRNVKDDQVKKFDKAYAVENQLEYFAELSCMYFGKGNYQTFNREELKAYDSVGYAMIEKMWGIGSEK